MDWFTIHHFGKIRQEEILAQAAGDDHKPLREYVADAGRFLIRIGQRLVKFATSQPETIPTQNPAENCC